MTAKKAKTPAKRTPEIEAAVLSAIEAGQPVRKACEGAGIAMSAFFRWLEADPALQERYARAKDVQMQALAAELVEIADEDPGTTDAGGTDGARVQHQKLRIDTRKWLLSKLVPKVYGDRITQEHTGANGGPIQIVTGIDREAEK